MRKIFADIHDVSLRLFDKAAHEKAARMIFPGDLFLPSIFFFPTSGFLVPHPS